MKIDWKSKETRYAITAFITVAAIIIFSRVIEDIDDLLGIMGTVCREASTILMPFIMGALICYILLPIVRWFDNKALRFIKWNKLRRGLSVLITYVVLLASLAWLMSYLVPILITNVQDFVKNLSVYLDTGEDFLQRLEEEIPMLGIPVVEKAVEDTLEKGMEFLKEGAASIVKAVPGYVMKLTGVLTDTLIAFITSIYLLLDIDRLKVSAKRITAAALKAEHAEKVFQFAHDADRIFGRYVRSRLFESVIVFVATLIGFTAYDVPYTVLFALVEGITNIVPFFGPIVGGVIIVVLVLLISPEKAIFAGVFVTLLQQLDGYVIGPKVMGDGVDLRPFWILFAVSAGGVFGVAGMVLAVPVVGFIGTYLSRFTASRLGPKPEEPKKTLFKRKKSK